MTMPRLPPELLNEIMPLSLASPTRDGLRSRNEQLCRLALVDRTWQRFAQSHLDDHLRLRSHHFRRLEAEHPDRSPSPPPERGVVVDAKTRRSRELASRGLATTTTTRKRGGGEARTASTSQNVPGGRGEEEEEEGEVRGRTLQRRPQRVPIIVSGGARERASKVGTLVINKCLDDHRFSVAKRTLGAFTQVDTVFLSGTSEWYSLTALTELPKLTSLHLARVYHALPPSTPFRSLRTLSISFGLPKLIDWTLLRARVLPSLKTLILNPTDWDFIASDGPTFYAGFASIAPQLEALLLAGQDRRNDEEIEYAAMFAQLASIKHLELRTTSDAALKAVASIPTNALVSLRLSKRMRTNGALSQLLFKHDGERMTSALAVQGLKRLTLARDGGGDAWRRTTGSNELTELDRRSAIRWCASHGVQLEWNDEDTEPVEEWRPELA